MTAFTDTDVPRVGVVALERLGVFTVKQLRSLIADKKFNLRGQAGIGPKSIRIISDLLAQPDKAKAKPKSKKPDKKPAKPIGRPSAFTQDIADKICMDLSMGETLPNILSPEGMPSGPTVWKWRRDRPEFLNDYMRAREEQTRTWADEIISLADDSSEDWQTCTKKDGSTFSKLDRDHVSRVSLQIDSRKWLMARVNRAEYGDNQKIDLTATIESKDDKELMHELQLAAAALGISVDDVKSQFGGGDE